MACVGKSASGSKKRPRGSSQPPSPPFLQCTHLRDAASDDALWASLGKATWPSSWAASAKAAPKARTAFARRASLPPGLAAGVDAVAAATKRAASRPWPHPVADGADFEAAARGVFAAGLPPASDPALRRAPEYGLMRECVAWWLNSRPATVVAFARAPVAALAERGGAAAALTAWPDIPWRASALALLADAAAGLGPGEAAGVASVLGRLEVEGAALRAALASLAVDDADPPPPASWDDEGGPSADDGNPLSPLSPAWAWAAEGGRRRARTRAAPCAAVPAGVPASHWWWRGRTPAEAGVEV